jgi:hypothetical protein
MIDLTIEVPIPLVAARGEPILSRLGRGGGPPSVKTLHEWTKPRDGRPALESVKMPRGVCTSREALVRFAERLTTGATAEQRTPTQAKRSHERARAYLAAQGIA